MEVYDSAASATARSITNLFSSSFGMASRLFPKSLRQDIYNIYGLVRLADEIVDTYRGDDAAKLLDELEFEVYAALQRQYSTNLVVHAFQLTANRVTINKTLIKPFFESMRIDQRGSYSTDQYEAYIYGSAEVVGLMCLKVFCEGDGLAYQNMEKGASALGAAFQKTNFLRDIADDHERLGRYYFPTGSYAKFNEATKQMIASDIYKDFESALPAIRALPNSARPAVMSAYQYYLRLLTKLEETPAVQLKENRVRLPDTYKLWLLARTLITERLHGPRELET